VPNYFTFLNGYPAGDLWTRLESDNSKDAHNTLHIHWNVECIRQHKYSLTPCDAIQACKCMSPFQRNRLPSASKWKTVRATFQEYLPSHIKNSFAYFILHTFI
jgi:hypothetical protein